MEDGKILVLETKVDAMEGDIKELYKRSSETSKVMNELNISIIQLSGALQNFTTRLDGSIESLAMKLDDKISQMNGEINKIACKNEKADDREKKNTDSIKIAVVGGLIGIGLGAIAVFLGLK